MSEFSTVLREWRSRRGLTLGGLALKSGVAKATLSYWEAGKRQPSLTELDAVLDALQVGADERRRMVSGVDAARAVRRLRREAGIAPTSGDLLRALRHRRGWSLERTAAELGIRHSTVSRWERSGSWPDPEQLQLLCRVLNARPEECSALAAGRFLPVEEPPPDLDSLRDRLAALCGPSDDPSTEALKELRFFSLEAELCVRPTSMSGSADACLDLLARVVSRHARFLGERGRFEEALAHARRAETIADGQPHPVHPRLLVSLVRARATALGRSRDPERAAHILAECRDGAPPDWKAWVLSDMASYLGSAGESHAAIRFATEACREVENWNNPIEHWLRCRDLAHHLIRAGRVAEALPYLPDARVDRPAVERIGTAQSWAEALLALGEADAAGQRIALAFELIEAYQLHHMRPELESLARQLPL